MPVISGLRNPPRRGLGGRRGRPRWSLPPARPLQQLDGPEGVVGEVGPLAAAGIGDGLKYFAEVPEFFSERRQVSFLLRS